MLAADGSVEYVISTWRDAQAEVEYRDALDASVRQARELADAYKAARNEAIEASTAKTAFLSRMSHELRTPLNAVLGFAQLLALDPLTAEQAEAVEHIRSGGRHLLDLINEILDISRIEAGRLALSMEPVDAGEVVAEAVDLVRPAGPAVRRVGRRAGLRRAEGAGVYADRQRMRQVLLNLVSNAVKYNRPGGSVRVGCRPGGSGEVVVEVSDTGPGIADELLPRLFQPFDRLGAESSGVEGTGIGLALADGLARAMGGRIDVATRLGTGSTFTLVLRGVDAAPRTAPCPPSRSPTCGAPATCASSTSRTTRRTPRSWRGWSRCGRAAGSRSPLTAPSAWPRRCASPRTWSSSTCTCPTCPATRCWGGFVRCPAAPASRSSW